MGLKKPLHVLRKNATDISSFILMMKSNNKEKHVKESAEALIGKASEAVLNMQSNGHDERKNNQNGFEYKWRGRVIKKIQYRKDSLVLRVKKSVRIADRKHGQRSDENGNL